MVEMLYYSASLEPDETILFKFYVVQDNELINLINFQYSVQEMNAQSEEVFVQKIKDRISEHGIGYKKIKRL